MIYMKVKGHKEKKSNFFSSSFHIFCKTVKTIEIQPLTALLEEVMFQLNLVFTFSKTRRWE